MRIMARSFVILGALAAFGQGAAAQPAPGGAPYVPPSAAANAGPGFVQNRLNDQQARINQGVANGTMTRRDVISDERNLQRDRAIRNQDLRANGGHLTKVEKRELDRRLNRNSARIYDQKHGIPPK